MQYNFASNNQDLERPVLEHCNLLPAQRSPEESQKLTYQEKPILIVKSCKVNRLKQKNDKPPANFRR